MTMDQSIALQPLWVQYWLYVLIFGTLILPLALLIWRQTRLNAIITFVTSVLAGFCVSLLFDKLGYVKLLGLPHIILWTPLVIYLFGQIKRTDMPLWPRRILMAVSAVILISLMFDYVDVARYVLGERASSVPL